MHCGIMLVHMARFLVIDCGAVTANTKVKPFFRNTRHAIAAYVAIAVQNCL
jgi:hypothetical protein